MCIRGRTELLKKDIAAEMEVWLNWPYTKPAWKTGDRQSIDAVWIIGLF